MSNYVFILQNIVCCVNVKLCLFVDGQIGFYIFCEITIDFDGIIYKPLVQGENRQAKL